MERKYRQRGYQEYEKTEKEKGREQRPAQGHPRLDRLGPRTPRMVGTVVRARCANCGHVLAATVDLNGQCPRCGFELHSCKQCVHFDSSARFECTQPIPERIPRKDARNECTFFEFRMTVEKDTAPASPSPSLSGLGSLSPQDARKAFEDLFKK